VTNHQGALHLADLIDQIGFNLGGFAQRAQDEREGGEPLLAIDQAVLGDVAGND
jgi:hypothetical protein